MVSAGLTMQGIVWGLVGTATISVMNHGCVQLLYHQRTKIWG